jgi:Fe-S cluster biogenesis protein NfuA
MPNQKAPSMTLEQRIEQALAEVRPYLESDGGGIELVRIEAPRVYVRLLGACQDCSVNHTTMKLGVENSIRSHAPEIEEVVALDYGA